MSRLSDEELAAPVAAALLHRIVRFGRALRDAGLHASPARLADFAGALACLDVGRRDDFYYAARITLLTRPDQREAFDALFARFWPPGLLPLNGPQPATGAGSSSVEQAPSPMEAGGAETPDAAVRRLLLVTVPAAGEDAEQNESAGLRGPASSLMSYSQEEVLREKNFSDFSEAEVAAARRLMERLRWRVARRLTRRSVVARRGRTLDLRNTMRRAFTTGGETLTWARRQRKVKPRPLVLICDVSGSMERYTRLLLQFLHTISHGTGASVETFLFATRLTRITTSLKRRRVDEAMERVAKEVADWSGGTRTGEALADFNRTWARRVLGRGAVVLIISDGWDRGNVHQLSREIARLRRTAYRLIWLNPLLGTPGYRPMTRGMVAALPHLDEFLPVHNLQSLEALVERLAALPVRRTSDRGLKRAPPLVAPRS